MFATIDDASAVFGAGYGALLMPLRNYFTLVGSPTQIPLRATTSWALHDEVMDIASPFDLVVVVVVV